VAGFPRPGEDRQYDSYDPKEAGDRGPAQRRGYRQPAPDRPGHGRAAARCRPAQCVDAAGRRRPAVARGPRRPWLPRFRVRQAAWAPDRHLPGRRRPAARAAPRRRGAEPGALRGGHQAGLTAARGRAGRRAARPGATQAATPPSALRRPYPGSRRRRSCRARAAPGGHVRRHYRRCFRGRPDAGAPDLGGVHRGRAPGAYRRRDLRRQRGRRRAARACAGAGRDDPGGVPARLPDRGRRGLARAALRQPRAGGQHPRVPGGQAYPAGGIGSDAGPGAVRP
jgi:hypothetical protein